MDSNLTHYSTFDKYMENRKKSPKWFELGNYIALAVGPLDY